MKFVIIFVIASVFLADVLGAAITDPRCTHLNEKYHNCSNGCDFTCENYAIAGMCVCLPELAGCYCDVGWVRNSNRDCVLEKDCTKTPAPEPEPTPYKPIAVEPQQPYCKGRHESFVACGTLRPLTCATKDRVYKWKAGSQSGCFCNKGFLRDSKNECVPIAKCD